MLRWRLLACTGLLGVAACTAGGVDVDDEGLLDEAEGALCQADSTALGIDVSYAQGWVNWSQVKASGRSFAYAKASEGTAITDVQFANNWSNMKAQGVIRGAYHYFKGQYDGATQASWFLSRIQNNGGLQAGDLPPAVDIEYWTNSYSSLTGNTAQDLARLRQMLDAIYAATGRVPVIYTNWSTWVNQLGNPTGFENFPLWLANWGSCTTYQPPSLPQLKVWQHGIGSSGTVPGVGEVDLDKFNGTYSDLLAFAGGSPPATNNADVKEGGSTVPTSMSAGATQTVTVKLYNNGTTTWKKSTLHRLGATASNGVTWTSFGSCGGYANSATDSRVELCSDVPPGGTYNATFGIKAPTGVSSTTFSVRMVQDGVGWFGETQNFPITVTSGGGGTCSCSGGATYWGSQVPASSTYCGFTVCGGDNQLYSCQAGGWTSQGGSPCNCRCTGGSDYLGNAINPDYTYCGFTVCGGDYQTYKCTSSGWSAQGTTCP